MSDDKSAQFARKITFSREGLIPSVAGLTCTMTKDGHFTSSQLSKFIQHIYGNFLSSEFTQVEEEVTGSEDVLDEDTHSIQVVEAFRIHGQSLQNLIQYWSEESFIKRASGQGRQTLYSVTEEGAQHFMEQVFLCDSGLNELRVDYLLLALYSIRSTPVSILQEVYPGLKLEWTNEDGAALSWKWDDARDRFVRLLELRRKKIEDYNAANDQLPEIISEATKKAGGKGVAAIIASLLVIPAAFLTLPLLGYFAYRSQRDPNWHKELRVLANMYESFRASFVKQDMVEGLQYRSSVLYAPMAQIIGQVIRTLERLK
jgi:hypothetical protein